MNNVFIQANVGRFAHQLYPIYTALSIKDVDQIYIIDNKIKQAIFDQFSDELKEKVHFYSNEVIEDTDIILQGYCQNVSEINTDIIRSYFKCPKSIENKILEYYGDLSNHVCLHVRRGDYIGLANYLLLSKQYIEHVIQSYCNNLSIICISDDIDWCKKHLSHLKDITFADLHNDEDSLLIDFYIQTFTKCNICSASSFSMAGALLNPNNEIYVPYPYYSCEEWNNREDLQIIPDYAIKVPYKMTKMLNYITPQ